MGTRYHVIVETPEMNCMQLLEWMAVNVPGAQTWPKDATQDAEGNLRFVGNTLAMGVFAQHPWTWDDNNPFPNLTHSLAVTVPFREDNRHTRMQVAQIAGVLCRAFPLVVTYNGEQAIAEATPNSSVHTFEQMPYVADVLARRGELEWALAVEDHCVPTGDALYAWGDENHDDAPTVDTLLNRTNLNTTMATLAQQFVDAISINPVLRRLDYIGADVLDLDDMLDETWPNGVSEDDLEFIASTMGAFIGEVITRQIGGKWFTEGENGEEGIDLGSFQAFPISAAYKRVTAGRQESIARFYQGLRKVAG